MSRLRTPGTTFYGTSSHKVFWSMGGEPCRMRAKLPGLLLRVQLTHLNAAHVHQPAARLCARTCSCVCMRMLVRVCDRCFDVFQG